MTPKTKINLEQLRFQVGLAKSFKKNLLNQSKQILVGSYFFNKRKCRKRIAAKHAAELAGT
jgi:hypothetical protein